MDKAFKKVKVEIMYRERLDEVRGWDFECENTSIVEALIEAM